MQLRWKHVSAPPSGELSPQVTERAIHGNVVLIISESTHVGDGLRTSRNYNNGIMIHLCPLYSAPRLAFGKGRYARPPAGGCPSMPCGIATSPEGRGKNASMRVKAGIRLGSPFGEAVTAGD